MPLSFLVPAFLAGLAALAVPVLLHLSRRQSERVQEFPSLMFLRRLPQQTEKRRRLRDLLLLLVRCAALAILVLAFARPVLDRPVDSPVAAGGARELVILLDRSASMGYGDRWQRATDAARAAIDGLGSGDRATVVAFDDAAEMLSRASRDRATLGAALDAVQPGSARSRFTPGLKLAESVLASSPLPRRELLLISDFQRTAWDAGAAEGGVHLPAGTRVRHVSVGGADEGNVAVTGVEFQRQSLSGRERVVATARVVNRGDAPVGALPVALEVEGRRLEVRSVDVPASGAVTVEFAPFTLSARNTRGSVLAGDDPLPADNRFHFVLSPDASLGVLIAEGPTAPSGASLYLQRALSIGAEPGFRVDTRRSSSLSDADLQGRSVVVLNDAPLPEGEPGRRLREFVERGGGLLLVAGPSTGGAPGRDAGWLDAVLGRSPERASEAGVALGFVDLSHPIFEPFTSPRSGNFASARFYGYRSLEVADSARALARFSDGSVALLEGRLGRGRVLAWGSSLDQSWNDLPLQPVFLPFAHQLVRYAAGHSPQGAWRTVGEMVSPLPAGTAGAETWVRAPSGERRPLEADAPHRLAEQGFHELRGGTTGDRIARVIAANLDPAESDLTEIDPAEVVNALAPADEAAARPLPFAAPTASERERQQAVWWYLMVAALVLLTADVLYANRRIRATR
jgi:hypothetical protein